MAAPRRLNARSAERKLGARCQNGAKAIGASRRTNPQIWRQYRESSGAPRGIRTPATWFRRTISLCQPVFASAGTCRLFQVFTPRNAGLCPSGAVRATRVLSSSFASMVPKWCQKTGGAWCLLPSSRAGQSDGSARPALGVDGPAQYERGRGPARCESQLRLPRGQLRPHLRAVPPHRPLPRPRPISRCRSRPASSAAPAWSAWRRIARAARGAWALRAASNPALALTAQASRQSFRHGTASLLIRRDDPRPWVRQVFVREWWGDQR
jgi:hypothetical protein